ncbi:pilus assembly protein TadG-related protein [Arthrobacter cryoconiti]|uniref:Pilus assembly protein TadG-related protein n=1 Tax=Arthrobacter cryoconiti TaxID=748907 RepID=A0ABV8QVK7_9MICC|nr:pilus assembly protein TadG-related protein [Arthrobacter cryoconiti]MCC9068997.1 pilus assembly protein TadG-related protein [Arthrobacter cryoconiti]
MRAKHRPIEAQKANIVSEVQGPDGQIMVLLVGYVLLALLLMTVVAASSSLYLAQKKLLSVADGAALAAADTFTLQGGTAAEGPGTLLTVSGVGAAAQAYLDHEPPTQSVTGMQLAGGTGTTDGRSAQVTLTGVVHPLFINLFIPDGIVLTVTGTARAHLVF